jgi:hypothetical protein
MLREDPEVAKAVLGQAGATVNLPGAVGFNAAILVKKVGAGAAVTVQAAGSQTIDGAATYSLSTQYKYVRLLSDGSNWQIVAAN